MDDYSDYLTSFTVRPYPYGGEDNDPFPCAAASSGPSRSNVYVRFSHHIDDEELYEIESRTICLSEDVLAEESGDDCRSFIVSEGLCYWPIDAETVLDIADEVVKKAVQFKCNLRVEIRSVIRGSDDDAQETYEDDRDSGAASSGGGLEVKSLKRKRIACDERDRCCVICLEVLTAGIDVVGVMPCSHCSFHDDCLSSWLERSPSCPLCRRKTAAAAAAASDSGC
ncbi:PREDICTED: uncharacterized protein LOC109151188 [Ipomoea nil]|uniref:uncharacterized protein LOC109151188 n=1 Tax=Ipomoea nil TaxID=35883 RepID=UPI000901B094|nr:PREDICTED: uncharacterized protein LOC109151188 [Ipomoea nil]